MSDFRYRWPILYRKSRQPELMDRMMERMGVDATVAAHVDGGMAWYEARTKCIFCCHEGECRNWLEGSEELPGPADFCPNVEFFRLCSETNALHRPAALRMAGHPAPRSLPGQEEAPRRIEVRQRANDCAEGLD